MEIKRKSMSDEQLSARENELIAEVNAVCDGYRDRFSFLGYELNVEIDEKKADDYEFSPRKDGEEHKPEYVSGYACRATVTVRRPKSDDEMKQDAELEEELSAAEKECSEKVDEGGERRVVVENKRGRRKGSGRIYHRQREARAVAY